MGHYDDYKNSPGSGMTDGAKIAPRGVGFKPKDDRVFQGEGRIMQDPTSAKAAEALKHLGSQAIPDTDMRPPVPRIIKGAAENYINFVQHWWDMYQHISTMTNHLLIVDDRAGIEVGVHKQDEIQESMTFMNNMRDAIYSGNLSYNQIAQQLESMAEHVYIVMGIVKEAQQRLSVFTQNYV